MMETLNTVWTALTTTNDELINIFLFFLSFIDAYLGMLLFTTLLNIKSTKKQKLQYVLSLSILAFIIRVIFKNPLATYLNMILTLVLILKIFKKILENKYKIFNLANNSSTSIIFLLEVVYEKNIKFFMFYSFSLYYKSCIFMAKIYIIV